MRKFDRDFVLIWKENAIQYLHSFNFWSDSVPSLFTTL